MSPIFVRPVREQLEHDRLIRHLQAKYKRKFDVATNIGDEQVAPVKIGPRAFFPDLVLTSGGKLAGVVEIETGESVNNLEAMAQWVHFAKSRVPFHLYVPVNGYDSARRLCEAHQTRITEIWTYRPAGDDFDLVRMHVDAPPGVRADSRAANDQPGGRGARARPAAGPPPSDVAKPAAKTAAKPAAKPVARPAAKATARAAAKPAAARKPAARPAAKKPAARSKRR